MKILPILGIAAAISLNSLPATANPTNPHEGKSLPPGIEKNMSGQENYRQVGKKS